MTLRSEVRNPFQTSSAQHRASEDAMAARAKTRRGDQLGRWNLALILLQGIALVAIGRLAGVAAQIDFETPHCGKRCRPVKMLLIHSRTLMMFPNQATATSARRYFLTCILDGASLGGQVSNCDSLG
eukprot:2603871-Rhodomonas_salina.1